MALYKSIIIIIMVMIFT